MFPTIARISDLLPFVQQNVQIRVKDGMQDHKIVSYQVQDEDTFTGEHEAFERECRGITFNRHGVIVARTMHKFFNIGQRDDVRPENLNWPKVTRIMVKRDGSMVTPVLLSNGDIKYKTKNSFATKEAALADEVSSNTPNSRYWLMGLFAEGLTPTFEITSAKYPIVLRYAKDELTLLHVRENVFGRYLSEQEIQQLKPPFPIVENVQHQFLDDTGQVSWEKLKHYGETAEGVEGVVIQFGQDMVKLKTVWYSALHHAVTFTRWRDIARAVVADKADDLKGAFALTGRSIGPIVEVEHKILQKISVTKAEVQEHVNLAKAAELTPKDLALKYKDHELFGLIMNTFRAKEIEWFVWYERHHLDTDWNLEVVPNEEE